MLTLRLITTTVILAGSGLATPIPIATTTTNGTIPTTTTTYSIITNETPREIFSANNNGVWSWTNGFPEFLRVGPVSITVNFSAPVPIAWLVVGLNSFSNQAGPGSLTVGGGTATTADFDLMAGLPYSVGMLTWDGATGTITPTNINQALMLGSTSFRTITTLTLSAPSTPDGYTGFFGTMVSPAQNPVPEPGSWALYAVGLAIIGRKLAQLRRRP